MDRVHMIPSSKSKSEAERYASGITGFYDSEHNLHKFYAGP